MLAFLTDAHISPKLAEQMNVKRPDITIHNLQTWRGGTFLEAEDDDILTAAHEEDLTLITYDQTTIMPLVTQWAVDGRVHSGVVFVDRRSIPSADIGAQIRAVIALWEISQTQEWTNVVTFLKPPPKADK